MNRSDLELSQVATVMSERERKMYRIVDAATCLVFARYWHALEDEEQELERVLQEEGYLNERDD